MVPLNLIYRTMKILRTNIKMPIILIFGIWLLFMRRYLVDTNHSASRKYMNTIVTGGKVELPFIRYLNYSTHNATSKGKTVNIFRDHMENELVSDILTKNVVGDLSESQGLVKKSDIKEDKPEKGKSLGGDTLEIKEVLENTNLAKNAKLANNKPRREAEDDAPNKVTEFDKDEPRKKTWQDVNGSVEHDAVQLKVMVKQKIKLPEIDQIHSTVVPAFNQNTTKQVSAPVGTLHDFPYIINNKTICDGVNLTYIIYVHSAPKNVRHRLKLRQTWARNSVIPAYQSRIVFMIGNTPYKDLQEEIYKESQTFGDIIQEDYIDSYKNLTHKAVGALKWITHFCNKAKFVIKTDDDVYADIFHLLNLIKEKYWESKKYLLGNVYRTNSMPVLRDTRTCMKWCIKESEFKGNYYPRYLSGGFLVISGDLIKDLYLASKKTPFFWVDDVYVSGLLPKKVENITYIPINELYQYRSKLFKDTQNDKKKPIVTLTNYKIQFWLSTLHHLPEKDRHSLGTKYYSSLISEAEQMLEEKM